MPDTRVTLSSALAERYRIEGKLGAGGMAMVYLADDVRHRRNVAVKVLHPELAHQLGADRFLREIEIVARLQHPHIVPVFDSGDADGTLFFVMPRIEGESMRARLERDGKLPIDESVRLVREVVDALEWRDPFRMSIHREKLWDSVRQEPAFQDIVWRLGVPA